ncbi:hypothetical protein MPER_11703 [Moniliophthora perniciosa FA553]|nr:hypothetical protein MPER_11703 [Moniliophthora perniciosa FA553]
MVTAKVRELSPPFGNGDIFSAFPFQPFGKAIIRDIASKPQVQVSKRTLMVNVFIFMIGTYYNDAALDGRLDPWILDLVAWCTVESKARGLEAPWLRFPLKTSLRIVRRQ